MASKREFLTELVNRYKECPDENPRISLREIRRLLDTLPEHLNQILPASPQPWMEPAKGQLAFEYYDGLHDALPVARISWGGYSKYKLPALVDEPSERNPRNNIPIGPRQTRDGYSAVVDKLISKYGPDAEYKTFEEIGSPRWGTIPLEKENENDKGQLKGGGKGPFESQFGNGFDVTKWSGGGSAQGADQNAFGTQANGQMVGSNSGKMGNAPGGKSQPMTGGNTPAQAGQCGSMNHSQHTTTKSEEIGNQFGVGSRMDAYQKDASGPISPHFDSRKTTPTLNGTETETAFGSNQECSGGMYPHPQNFFESFEAFTNMYKRIEAPLNKIPISTLLQNHAVHWPGELNVSMGVAAFSEESTFRDGNPGGYIDSAMGKLRSKQLRSQASSICEYMDGFFKATEVGVGLVQTPRIDPTKLIKELVSKSVRLSRAAREEQGSGLKMVLVDISPSCSGIRDACYAAAVALANSDSNVVVLAHFNGYMYGSEGMLIGSRQAEIPLVHEDPETGCASQESMDRMRAFLGSGNLSGAIAFGDCDAAELYSIIAMHVPLVWMTPHGTCSSIDALKTYSPETQFESKAGLYIIPDVQNATEAVVGLRAATKATRV